MPLGPVPWEYGNHELNRRGRAEFYRRLDVVRALFRARGAPALGSRPLAQAGYVTEEDIATAADASLRGLRNVGPGVLRHIRTVFPLSGWRVPAWMHEE